MQIIILTLLIAVFGGKMDVSIETRPGHYYNHQCQISFSITSDVFSRKTEVFHIYALKNVKFIETGKYTPTIIRLRDRRETIFQYVNNCLKDQTQFFQCALITYNKVRNENPCLPVNKTHYMYTFRLKNGLCPVSHENNEVSFMIQVTNGSQIKLSGQYTVKLPHLSYRQIKQVYFSNKNNFLVGCQSPYSFGFQIWNSSFAFGWEFVEVQLKHDQKLIISKELCEPSCDIEGNNKIIFKNKNFTEVQKYYTYDNYELFPYGSTPTVFNFTFGIKLMEKATTEIKITIRSKTNKFQQNFIKNTNYIYGYGKNYLYSLEEEEFLKVQPLVRAHSCLEFQQQFHKENFNILILIGVVLLALLVSSCRSEFFIVEKYVYMLILLTNVLVKLLYMWLGHHQEIKFIIMMFLIIEIFLNIVYYTSYACFNSISEEMRKSFAISYLLLVLFLLYNYRFYSIVLLRKFEEINEEEIANNIVLFKKHCLHIVLSTLLLIVELSFIFNDNLFLDNIEIIKFVVLFHDIFLLFGMILTLKVFYVKLRQIKYDEAKESNEPTQKDEPEEKDETETARELSKK